MDAACLFEGSAGNRYRRGLPARAGVHGAGILAALSQEPAKGRHDGGHLRSAETRKAQPGEFRAADQGGGCGVCGGGLCRGLLHE